MGRLTRVLVGAREKRYQSTFQTPLNVLGYLGYQGFQWNQPASGEVITSDSAIATVNTYACIRLLADSCGQIPLLSYHVIADEQRERADQQHPTVQLLRQPVPRVSQFSWISTMVAHLNGWGDAFIGKPRNSNGDIYALPLIRPERVNVRINDDYEPEYIIDGKYGTPFNWRDVLHIRALSTDGVRGLSPINQARQAIGTTIALERDAGRAAGNSYLPEVVLKTDTKLSQGAADNLRGRFRQAISEPGAIPVLEEGLDLQAITISPRDAQFIEQRKYSATEIARIFRVPPYMVGADSPNNSLTYSNITAESLHFLQYSLNPWLVAIEQALALDEDLYPADGSLFPEFRRDAMLQMDTPTRYAAWFHALGGAPFMESNRARRLENWPPLEGGDILPVEKPGPTKFIPEPAEPTPDTGVPDKTPLGTPPNGVAPAVPAKPVKPSPVKK
jgi:HK97 family phage portal protein